jgi:hypothetical protein
MILATHCFESLKLQPHSYKMHSITPVSLLTHHRHHFVTEFKLMNYYHQFIIYWHLRKSDKSSSLLHSTSTAFTAITSVSVLTPEAAEAIQEFDNDPVEEEYEEIEESAPVVQSNAANVFHYFQVFSAIVVSISWIFLCAAVFCTWEEWTYFESFYFFFISLSTIGNHSYLLTCFTYI